MFVNSRHYCLEVVAGLRSEAKKLKDDQKRRREMIKNHFLMMSWLSRFIERNKFAWERRRAAQERDKQEQNEFEKWKSQDPEKQIEEMKKEVESRKQGGIYFSLPSKIIFNPQNFARDSVNFDNSLKTSFDILVSSIT